MSSVLLTTTTTNTPINGVAAGLWLFVVLGCAVLMLAGYWRILSKANEPGWAILIPIYGLVKLLQISGRSGWWVLLACVPYVGIIALIVLYVNLARVFGKGIGFAIGLLLLPIVFVPILGFGSAEYLGPVRLREELARAA